MKGKHVAEFIKDFIIGILIVICIVIILSIVLYDKISITRVIPESEEYTLTEEMEEELKKANLKEAEEVVINYYIDAADLKKYEKTNEYVKGKSNPFAISSDYEGNSSSQPGNNVSDSKNGNQGFYQDEGIK